MTFLTNLTLEKKIILLTALGLALGVAVLSSLGMRAVNQATETMLKDRLTTAHLLADYADEALGRAQRELNYTALAITTDGTRSNLEERVRALEETYSHLSVYLHSIYLVNEAGQAVWSQPDLPPLRDIDMRAYPGVNEVLAKGKSYISGLVSAPVSNTPVIFLTSLVQNGGGKRALVAAIDITQSSVGGFIKPIRLGQTGYVEIVDQNGIVVTRTEPGPKLAPFEQSDHSGRFAALIDAGQPTRGTCHTCHEANQKVVRRDVLAFVPLAKANWGVVIRQSEGEALAPTRELRQSLFLFGIGLATVALLFVAVITRDVGSRIEMLTGASRRIAEGDLISPVKTAGRDEIGILAQTLDGMRVKLKTSHGDLEQKTKELASLLSVSEILTSTLDLPRLLEGVLAKATEVIPGADGGILLLAGPEHGGVALPCAIGLDKNALTQAVADINRHLGAVDNVAEKDLVLDVGIALLQSDVLRDKVQGAITAEVFHRERHIGTLIMVSFKNPEAFSESDRRLLQAIADYVAIGIERSQLITKEEEARALREVDRLRAQFISSVSHELRTPLTLIKGYSTSLLRRDVTWDEATQQEFLQIIDEKTDELRDLIDKLLQSAKLEAGALKLEKEPVLLPRLAQRVVDDFAPRTRKHQFVLDFPAHFPVVEADMRCMEQVMRNLVENAIKYSPEGGKIVVSGQVSDGKVVLSVSDEGIGIAAEHQDRIFGRFYRVGGASTQGIPGSGLGLFITRGHVEAHGGNVWLKSTAGKGSQFYFSLPLAQNGNGD
ncbi:MAG: HAMP domain-containing protein [Chloroflexi bacterium]|nr:HAMP domain-containing protein [Chloroflexota bacterium]